MDVVLTLPGIVVIGLGLYDMYHSLLHPSGRGSLSTAVLSAVWKLSRRLGHRFGSAVGPAAMAAVVVLWVLLQGVGWALLYLPHVPEGFLYSPAVDPADYTAFGEAVYVSFVTLATLGYGDVVATHPALRLISPMEALTGFALLTAALTWFTQVYPVLSRRRSLALELKLLADAGYAEVLPDLAPSEVSRVLDTLSAQVVGVRIDLTQHTESYYFQEEDPDLSLARQLPYALLLRDRAAASPATEVRISARRLAGAVEHLASKLRQDFLDRGESTEQVLHAYAEDHHRATRV